MSSRESRNCDKNKVQRGADSYAVNEAPVISNSRNETRHVPCQTPEYRCTLVAEESLNVSALVVEDELVVVSANGLVQWWTSKDILARDGTKEKPSRILALHCQTAASTVSLQQRLICASVDGCISVIQNYQIVTQFKTGRAGVTDLCACDSGTIVVAYETGFIEAFQERDSNYQLVSRASFLNFNTIRAVEQLGCLLVAKEYLVVCYEQLEEASFEVIDLSHMISTFAQSDKKFLSLEDFWILPEPGLEPEPDLVKLRYAAERSDRVTRLEQGCAVSLTGGSIFIITSRISGETLSWGIRDHSHQIRLAHSVLSLSSVALENKTHVVATLRGGTSYIIPIEKDVPIKSILYPKDVDMDSDAIDILQTSVAGVIAREPSICFLWPMGTIEVYACQLLRHTVPVSAGTLQQLCINGAVQDLWQVLRRVDSHSDNLNPLIRAARKEIVDKKDCALNLSLVLSDSLQSFRELLLILSTQAGSQLQFPFPSLIEQRRAQVEWRDWSSILDVISGKIAGITDISVIDFGCGPGVVSAMMSANKGWRVLGIDKDDAMIQSARETYPTLSFLLADASDLQSSGTLEYESFDLIVASFTVQYFMADLQKILCSQWIPLLKAGGVIVILETDGLFAVHQPQSEGVTADWEEMENTMWSVQGYDSRAGSKVSFMFKECGLEEIEDIPLKDAEFAFDGPCSDLVLKSWKQRLDRMDFPREFFGSVRYDHMKRSFIECILSEKHTTSTQLRLITARRPFVTIGSEAMPDTK